MARISAEDKNNAYVAGSREVTEEEVRAKVDEAMGRKGFRVFVSDILATIKGMWEDFASRVRRSAGKRHINWNKVINFFGVAILGAIDVWFSTWIAGLLLGTGSVILHVAGILLIVVAVLEGLRWALRLIAVIVK
jgi:hypothetical protein